MLWSNPIHQCRSCLCCSQPYLRQVSLTDGQWQLKLKSPRIGVGVSIVDASLNSTDNGTITYLSFKTDECVQYNQTEVTYGASRACACVCRCVCTGRNSDDSGHRVFFWSVLLRCTVLLTQSTMHEMNTTPRMMMQVVEVVATAQHLPGRRPTQPTWLRMRDV